MSGNIIVEFKNDKQQLEFADSIKSIEVDGRKLSDVHDLAQKVVGMTKTIKVLAFTATTLAIMAVGTVLFLAQWLLSHESSIEQLLLTGNDEYNEIRRDAEKWNSHRRQRAYVHIQELQGLYWNQDVQDWVKQK